MENNVSAEGGVRRLSLRGRQFDSTINPQSVSPGMVRCRVYEIKTRDNGELMICIVSENFHYITYRGLPGSWQPVLDSWFSVPDEILDRITEKYRTSGYDATLNDVNFTAPEDRRPILPTTPKPSR
jgi:hypothetical protein